MTIATTEIERHEAELARMVEGRLGEPVAELPPEFRQLIARAAANEPGAIDRLHEVINNRLVSRD